MLCPSTRSNRFQTRISLVLFVLIGMGLASQALALTSPSSIPSAPIPTGLFEVLCEGDCSAIPERRYSLSPPFAFDLGIKFLSASNDSPLSVDVYTPGNIYVFGQLTASESIEIFADEFYLDSDPTLPPIIGVPRPFPPGGDVIICACIEIVGLPDLDPIDSESARRIALDGDEIRLVDAVEAVAPPSTLTDSIRFESTGDIYLDVTMVEFLKIRLKAGNAIVIDGGGVRVVPEPSTALLLLVGLAALASRRRLN